MGAIGWISAESTLHYTDYSTHHHCSPQYCWLSVDIVPINTSKVAYTVIKKLDGSRIYSTVSFPPIECVNTYCAPVPASVVSDHYTGHFTNSIRLQKDSFGHF